MFSYAVANLFALVALFNQKLFRSVLPRATLRELLGFGTITQVSSVVHLLNKRLGYYFISKTLGLGAVGVYSSGVQLAEGLRLIGQSIALVQMSAISNRDDNEFAKQLTLQLLKLSFVLTLGGVLILNIIPASWYGMIFGRDFQEIKTIVLCLSPGVLALAANAVFSHFFSGSGIPTYNLKASFTGFVISVLALLFLIPYFGMNGAAISASLAYIAAIIYQWFVFRKLTNSSLQDLLISSKDIRTILASLKHFMRQQQ
ncbi:MAG TPA: polysaccharide biosynthesis C-terminal domain-containing protein [Bacteroidales bacterium]|nr:polysaccharide biosynthesis C-terminal domain-containing protein [Bacteroidales bacterium]